MKLIDKDRVVTEIEEIYQETNYEPFTDKVLGKRIVCKKMLDFLDTIETKEAASIWNNARKTIPEDSSNQIICIKEDDLAVATIGKLVHGTKKWAYLNDLLNISNVETKDVNLEKELKILDNTLFDLDGVAIAGATHYLTVEDVKDIAKRFYELGLNTQKGE